MNRGGPWHRARAAATVREIMASPSSLGDVVRAAVLRRQSLLVPPHDAAVCLFNGYGEGAPGLVLELFGRSLVLTTHAVSSVGEEELSALVLSLREVLPFVRSALWKRRGDDEELRRGKLLLGSEAELERRISENGVRYALDLRLHQDAGFYLDTRELRAWLKSELSGKTLLNTFAYTGSLGVAAVAGGAREVVHVDKHRAFLNQAKTSYTLNGFPVARRDFVVGDFFGVSSDLRRQNRLFDCVVLDPPFFASTSGGRVDLVGDAERLLNKARPLVADGGYLVLVNNALFVSGAEHMAMIERACQDGYLAFERTVPVPDDVVGLLRDESSKLPADPAPFNHPTKIALLSVRRKDGRKA